MYCELLLLLLILVHLITKEGHMSSCTSNTYNVLIHLNEVLAESSGAVCVNKGHYIMKAVGGGYLINQIIVFNIESATNKLEFLVSEFISSYLQCNPHRP